MLEKASIMKRRSFIRKTAALTAAVFVWMKTKICMYVSGMPAILTR